MHFQENDFYVVLTSNTPAPWSPDKSKENTNLISRFYTPLPHQKYFGTNQWEVALTCISYPHTWLNVEGEKYFIEFGSVDDTEQKIKIIIPEAHYDSGIEIVDQINFLIKNNGKKSSFIFNRFSNKTSIAVRNHETLKISKLLGSTLGIEIPGNGVLEHSSRHTDVGLKEIIFRGTNSVDLDLKTHNLFVYSDIVQQTILGGSYHPLLAIIPTKNGNYNSYVTERFPTPQYIPLNTNILSGIKISIKDDQDELIQFTAGRTLLNLHFRKK